MPPIASTDLPFEHADLLLEPIPPEQATALTQKRMLSPTAKDLPTMGLSLAALLELAGPAAGGQGVYRVVFPRGISGSLATAKDGSGYLGSILGDTGIAGQARLLPVRVNPMMLAVTLSLAAVTQQLNRIEQTQESILFFLQQDKESQARGDLYLLGDLTRSLAHQFDNTEYRIAALTQAQQIKGRATGNIDLHRKRIVASMDKHARARTGWGVAETLKAIEPEFTSYRLALQLYAHATFLEAVLGSNHDPAYLEEKKKDIRERDFYYRDLYTQCSEELERNKARTIDAHLRRGAAKASTKIGSAIGKAPILSRGPADEALIEVGRRLDRSDEASRIRTVQRFAEHKEAQIKPFVDGIDSVRRFTNEPVALLVSGKGVFLDTRDDEDTKI